MKNKKGFTLIELLAVIVVLAIIALIATPLIISIIEKAEMEAFRDTGYGIVESGRLYRVNEINREAEKEFTFPDNYTDLNFSGEVPIGGTVLLNSDSTIDLNIYNSKYCAVKSATDDIVNVGKVIKDDEGNVIDCDVVLVEDKCSNPEIKVSPSVDGNAIEKDVTIKYKTSASCDVKEYRVTYDGQENSGEWLLYDETINLQDNAKVEARLVSSKNKSDDSDIVEENVTGIVNVTVIEPSSNECVDGDCDEDDLITSSDKTELCIANSSCIPIIEIDKGECSIPSVSGIVAGWKQSKNATVSVDGSCDTLKYRINDGELITYSDTIKITENAGTSKNTGVKLEVIYSDSTDTKTETTATVYIYQIDNISPYTPILNSYKTVATKLDDYGMECSTDDSETTDKTKCAIWVNCIEGEDDGSGSKYCIIPLDITRKDNENGSGIKKTWYKYSFVDSDGNKIEESTNEWTVKWNSGRNASGKEKSVYTYKLEDFATNESSEMELTIYWKATEKGSLSDTCQSDIWDGSIDTSWYNVSDTEFTINNASELAGLSKLVNEGTDDFSGKTINLGCSINLNDVTNYDNWSVDDYDASSLNEWIPIGGQQYDELTISDRDEYSNSIDEYGVLYTISNNIYKSNTSYNSSYSTYYKQNSFKGVFNGNSYEIKGLYISNTDDSYSKGLFGYIKDSIVTDVKINKSYISVDETSGNISGIALNSSVKNIKVINSFINFNNSNPTNSESYVGGIIGNYYIDSFVNENIYINNNIVDNNEISSQSSSISLGGLVGGFKDIYSSKSYSTDFSISVSNNYNNSKVVNGMGAGGLIGYIWLNSYINVIIDNNINDGNIIGQYAGGMIGYSYGPVIMKLSNSTNNGDVNCPSNNYVGGMIGYIFYGDINIFNLVNNGNITGGGYGTAGIVGDAYNLNLYGDNLINNGNIISDGDYYVGGILGQTENLCDFKLDNSINNGLVSGKMYVGGIAGQLGIYSSNDITINNLINHGKIILNKSEGAGVVAYVASRNGKFNFTINTSINTGDVINMYDYPYEMAGIIAYVRDVYVTVNECYNSGTIGNKDMTPNNGYFGGIAGNLPLLKSYLYNNYNRGEIIGNSSESQIYTGGIVAMASESTIKNNYNTGNIQDGQAAGGIVGYASNGSVVENNYNYGNVSTQYRSGHPGGIIGIDSSDNIIKNNYNEGTVSSTGDYPSGGIAGNHFGSYTENYYLTGTAPAGVGSSSSNGEKIDDIEGKYESISKMPNILTVINSDGVFMKDIYNVNDGYPIFSREYDLEEYEKNNSITNEKCFGFSDGVITGYNENCGTNVVIPSKINGIEVTEIGEKAFADLNIENVTFPINLNVIGNSAFNGSSLNGTIVIPKNVVKIGTSAFYNTQITGLDMSGSINLVTIGQNAFNNLSTLTGTLVIPPKLTLIDPTIFKGISITSLDLSGADGLTSLNGSLFSGISTLKGTIVIPKNVTSVCYGTFSGTSITEIDFSKAENLTEIGYGAFYDLTTLTGTLVIPKNVTSLPVSPFDGTAYTEIDLSNIENEITLNSGNLYISTLTTIKMNDKVTLSNNSLTNTSVSKIIAGRSHDNTIDTSSLGSTASTIVVEYNDGYCTNDNNANFYAC